MNMKDVGPHRLCQCLSSLLQEGVSLCPDALKTLLVHQFSCSWDLSDEEIVGKPDDVCSQSDGWNLEEQTQTHMSKTGVTFSEKQR